MLHGFNVWLRQYIVAVLNDPRGVVCCWCGRPNFYCDDCGFFAITPTGKDTCITCRACWRGPKGEAHITRYGLGER